MNTHLRKTVVFLPIALLALLAISLKIGHLSGIEFLGFATGFGWMLYNIFGFIFDRDMSMRGKIIFSCDDDIAARRKIVFGGSVVIYGLLLIGLLRT